MADQRENQEHLKNLILSAKEGNKEAFEEVYNTYYTPLFHYIVARIKIREEAEDMTQTVFLKIWNAMPTWNESHTSPISFFFTVARNVMIDYFRKNTKREIVSDEVVAKFADTSGSTDKGSEVRELGEVIGQAIEKLSDEQKEIITLFYTNDFTYKEIAEITGKREDAIRQIHSRAIKKLRELYKY
jgi:RNA polymerase sigma-70 factor (ECF subfamily)